MLDNLLNNEKVEAIKSLLSDGNDFVILTHSRPDGDAMGSSLALLHFLKSCGKSATVILPNEYPPFLSWLPGIADVVLYNKMSEHADNLMRKADAFFCLDFNNLSRIEDAGKVVEALPAKRVLIDHHLDPAPDFHISVSHPEACSTCELLFRVLWQIGGSDAVTKEIAECLYTGIMTDTGNFAYASSRKEVYYIIAELISKGIDKDLIYRKVFYNYSFGRMRLMGYMMHEKLQYFPKRNAALITLSFEEMRRFNCAKGDTEGFVNMPLQIKGVRFTCFMREELPGKINISLRSVGDFPCNKVAERFFGGGGHKNASGGEVRGSMSVAVDLFMQALESFSSELIM